MRNNYLITGSSGFIGSHLVQFLLDSGIAESDIILADKNLPSYQYKNLTFFQGDLTNISFVKKIVKNVNIIYHLAALSGFGGKTLEDYRRGNVYTTKNILDCIKNNKIKKFIFFSTIAVYGLPSEFGDIINWNESHPQTYSEIYGQSKSEAEQLVKYYYKKYGISYTIIRPTSVYGPNDFGQLHGLYKAIDKGYFFHIGNGNNKLDFVYVHDVVKAARLAELSKKKASDYIIGSGHPVTMNTIVEEIVNSLGKSSQFTHIPKYIALLLGYITKLISTIIRQQLPLFPSRVKIMSSSYYYDISKAKNELNYQPKIQFHEGVKKTTEWYLNYKD